MKMFLMLCTMLLVAIGVESYLYHRYVRGVSKTWVRWGVKMVVALSWSAMLAVVVGVMWWEATEPWFMITILWMVWSFLLILFPSIVWAVFSWVPVRWVRLVGGGVGFWDGGVDGARGDFGADGA